MCYLGISHKLSVDIQIKATVDSLKTKDLSEAVGLVIVFFCVDAHRIIIGYIGRIVGDGKIKVGVLGHVKTVQLPV